MNTKPLPAIIMLSAGAIASVVGLLNQYELGDFLQILFAVLVIFYILGCVVKVILDKNISGMEVDEMLQQEMELQNEEMENINLEESSVANAAQTNEQ